MNYNIGYLPHPEGTHSTSNAYTPLAIVESGGKSYISKVSVPSGIAITNTNYWQVFAEGTGVTPQQLQEITAEVETTMLNQGFVQDSGYSTFKSDTQAALENITAPGNGTLTIQKNGTTVSTFTANSSSNVTANISVPRNLSDLGGTSGLVHVQDIYKQNLKFSPTDDYELVKIEKLPQNAIIITSGDHINQLKVLNYAYQINDPKCLQYETYIYITPVAALDIQAPAGSQFVNGLKRLDANRSYRITVRGYVWDVQLIMG